MNIYAGFAPREREREGGRERKRKGGRRERERKGGRKGGRRRVEEGGRQSHGSNHWRGQLNYWQCSCHYMSYINTCTCTLPFTCMHTHTTLHPHYHTASPLSLTTQHSSCTPLSPSHTSHTLSSTLGLYLAATMIFTLFTVQSHKTWTSFI